MGKYIACICEGGAERAIINLLLDNHKLIFERHELIDGEVLRCRSGADFEKKYLRKGFKDKITVYRILDSHTEKFNLSKAYKSKVDVNNVITAPEIEMLIICAEGRYTDYKHEIQKHPNLKPSSYCKSYLKYSDVKSYDFVAGYFSDLKFLLNSLYEYWRVSKRRKDEMTIWDLVRTEDARKALSDKREK